MHVLIFGKAGQVARELANVSWPQSWRLTIVGRDECDLMRSGAAANAIASYRPDIVINAAAYTAVDKAESEKAAAFALNADAPREIAIATAAAGIPLIHISTDYVFDGKAETAYRETDPCAPLSVYGASKLVGEIAVREHQSRHLILRTSWVFSTYGANFVRTMLRLGSERDELGIVGDQVGGPTAAADIALALCRIATKIASGKSEYGTFHYSGFPFVSWHGFAERIFQQAGKLGLKTPGSVRKITAAQYPTPAPRPGNSMLNCAAIMRDWGIEQPSWETALDRCIEQLSMRSAE